MTTLGKLGYFGDQFFQYAYLRVYASINGLRVEVPNWSGSQLFGLSDDPVSRSAQRSLRLGLDPHVLVALDQLGFDFKNVLGFLLKRHRPAVREVLVDIVSDRGIDPESGRDPCDELLGWFQLHTSAYAPYKEFIRDLYRPRPDLEGPLRDAWRDLTVRGRTVVGVHVRRGDRLNIPLNVNEWCTPLGWYREWLEANWHGLDEPVVFLASDSVASVRGGLDKYHPVTSDELLRDRQALKNHPAIRSAPFYPDFYFLGQCDVVLTSNSMFSFASAMLNERATLFLRPELTSKRLVPFDPWDSKPSLRRRMYTSAIQRNKEYLSVSHLAGGWKEVVKSALIRLPRFWLVRLLLNRIFALYHAKIEMSFDSY